VKQGLSQALIDSERIPQARGSYDPRAGLPNVALSDEGSLTGHLRSVVDVLDGQELRFLIYPIR
jgi:hypothetical protein